MPDAEQLLIRRLSRDDIPFGMKLKNLAGWNQLPADWERFLNWEPEGCFLATWNDTAAGTATTIRYGDRFGWVGMVLVHPDLRRRGIGSALLMRSINYLEERGVAAVKLDATPLGKQLYDTIGFEDEYLLERHVAEAPAPGEQEGIAPLTDDLVEAVCALDREAFGADRSRVLRRLHAEPDAEAFVACEGDRLTGYVFARPGTNARYLGPWVARDAAAAEALFCGALHNMAGCPVYVDISLANPVTVGIVRRYGFEKQRHLIRMFRGRNEHPGRTGLVYGIAGPEIG